MSLPKHLDISCRELVELVSDYLSGSLTIAQRLKIERHLLLCDPCNVYVGQVRQTIRLTHELREPSVAQPVPEALLAEFRARAGRKNS